MAYYAFIFKGDEDDRSLYEMHVMAEDMWNVLWDYDAWLREKIKYGEFSAGDEEIYQGVRDKLYEFMGDRDVNLARIG